MFVRNGATWTEQAKLLASDGAAGVYFGLSVAISGDTVVVSTLTTGSAYVFVRNGTTWTEQSKLPAVSGDICGRHVSLSGDTAVCSDEAADPGDVYVFQRVGAVWTKQAKLVASDAAFQQEFGTSVSLSGDTVVIGSPGDNGLAEKSGTAYVFTRSGGVWTEQNKLLAVNATLNSAFGTSVGLSGTTAMVGAPFTSDPKFESGAAYFFSPVEGLGHGEPCSTPTACASGFCVDGVCCSTACNGGDPTDCQACSKAAGAAIDGFCSAAMHGVPCRPIAGACDVAEMCDGYDLTCPADGVLEAGKRCRAPAGDCDPAEECDGVKPSCPADALSAMGTICRAANGPCDVDERCNGATAACPDDARAADGAPCPEGTCAHASCVAPEPEPRAPDAGGCACRAAGTPATNDSDGSSSRVPIFATWLLAAALVRWRSRPGLSRRSGGSPRSLTPR